MVSLTTEIIDHCWLTEQVRRPDCGAVVTFLGTVRDLTDGKVTTSLEYEAHPALAEKAIADIEAEARQRWPIGEVAVGASPGPSGHRRGQRGGRRELSASGRGVRGLPLHAIERLKEQVPIWKKENWADGTQEWMHPEKAKEREIAS